MSWLNQTIEFCKSMGRGTSQSVEQQVASHDLTLEQEAAMRDSANAKWLAEFEDSLVAEHGGALTPRQQGDRLLRLTKARALRRIATDRENIAHAS